LNSMERGAKAGSGGLASQSQADIDRRERLKQLALDTIDVSKDPYLLRNHLGTIECKLCSTLHNDEGNYLAHTQGKRHQTNLARRAAREQKLANPEATPFVSVPQPSQQQKKKMAPRRIKIGRPGYRVTKMRDPETGQRSLLFHVDYPEIEEGYQPRHRFMSSFEQKVDPHDPKYQYVL